MAVHFSKKNILVTGGAGFLGSHLIDALIKDPANNIIAADNFISGAKLNIDHLLAKPNFIFIKHDVTMPLVLESFSELKRFQVKVQGIQEIYHLACPTSPKNFDKYKIETLLANSCGTKNICELALKYKAKLFLASSSVIYGGRTKSKEIFEETYAGNVDPLSPRACYDEGKRFSETIVSTYRDTHSLEARIARIFRTYGPRMPLRDGQMIPDFVVNALDDKDLIIFGDKNFSSSLCYISDIVDGVIKLMNLNKDPGPVNLGSDEDIEIAAVAQKIIKMTESGSKIIFKAPLGFMRPLGLPDLKRVKESLGWLAVVGLEEGLKKTIDYVRAHKQLLGPGEE